MNIRNLLKKGKEQLDNSNIQESNLKTKILLSNLLGKNKEYLLIYDTEELSEDIVYKFLSGIEKLKVGEPIQYIIGKQEFFGLEFVVNKNVLIPQPDTEILVEEVLNIIEKRNLKILDLCTGSGAIGISIKKKNPQSKVYASDISKQALEIAKVNAKQNNTEIEFIDSNLFENINEKFDIIVSNPPYIESDIIKNLPEEVKNEPKLALDGGIDGLDFYRKIAEKAKTFLNENGTLALEIGYNQKEKVIEILKQNNYQNIYAKKDFGGNYRIIVAKV